MGLNVSEIVLVIVVIVLILGMGQLPSIAESIGRARKRALDGPDAAPDEINVSPPEGDRGPIARAPDEAEIRGPVEDAQVVPKD